MSKIETVRDFYKRKNEWLPDNLSKEIGHFNVFRLEPFKGNTTRPVPYVRRDYFKITLLVGQSTIEYADRSIALKKQASVKK